MWHRRDSSRFSEPSGTLPVRGRTQAREGGQNRGYIRNMYSEFYIKHAGQPSRRLRCALWPAAPPPLPHQDDAIVVPPSSSAPPPPPPAIPLLVLFVHGAGMSLDCWRPTCDILSSKSLSACDLCAVDLRGHGGSHREAAESADDAAATTATLGSSRMCSQTAVTVPWSAAQLCLTANDGLISGPPDGADAAAPVEHFVDDVVTVISFLRTGVNAASHRRAIISSPTDKDVVAAVSNGSSPVAPEAVPLLGSVVLVGHSLGGSIVSSVAADPRVKPFIGGLVVLDIVEETAKTAISGMRGLLARRPLAFSHPGAAVEWFVREGGMRNPDSARRCVPSLLVAFPTVTPQDDGGSVAVSGAPSAGSTDVANRMLPPAPRLLGRPVQVPPANAAAIPPRTRLDPTEEDASANHSSPPATVAPWRRPTALEPSPSSAAGPIPPTMYRWRTDLPSTEPF